MFGFTEKNKPKLIKNLSTKLLEELESIYDANVNYDGLSFDKVYLSGENEVEKMINKLLELKNSQIREQFILNIDLMEYVTQMDYVKDMVDDISLQKASVEEVASGSEQMSSAIEEISTHVQSTLNTTQEVEAISSESVNTINESFGYINKSFEEIKIVQGKMHDVAEGTKEIDSVVNIINSVAEQTNLLALNASIEAARSGDAGKGFAVVASEIKKLADNTKKSVTYIKNMVENLRKEILFSESAMNNAVEVFIKGREHIKNSTISLDKMEGSLKYVNSIFEGISANIEEHSASTQEIASRINEINHHTQRLNEVCMRTGQGIYDMSAHVENIKAKALPYFKDLKEEHIRKVTGVEHLLWKWKAYNAVCGFVKIDESTIEDQTSCNFGRAIERMKQNNPDQELVLTLYEPHHMIHSLTKEIIRDVNKGNRLELDAKLGELDEATRTLVQGLKRLKLF